MIIGAGSGIVLYLAKYSLYGLALLLGPGRDKYAAAAIEIDLGTVPEGNWIQWAVYYNNFSSYVFRPYNVCILFLVRLLLTNLEIRFEFLLEGSIKPCNL